ncbi:hypothetical protein, partial [Flammeovirga aprica]
MYERLYREKEQTSSEKKKNYASYSSKEHTFDQEEKDPNNASPLEIKIEIYPTDDELFFSLYYLESNAIYSNVPRKCVIGPLRTTNPFVAEEIRLPNSGMMAFYKQLNAEFEGVQFIKYYGGATACFTKKTFFSPNGNEKGGYTTYGFNKQFKISDYLGIEKGQKLDQDYKTYKSKQPLPINYHEICKNIYEETFRNEETLEYINVKIRELLTMNNIVLEQLRKDNKLMFFEPIEKSLQSAFYTILGPREGEILEMLKKVDGHPPSIEKLKTTFSSIYKEELDDFIIEHIPNYRKRWSKALPNLQADPLELEYEKMASIIYEYYQKYLVSKKVLLKKLNLDEEDVKSSSISSTILFDTGVINNYQDEIETELIKLDQNRASIQQLDAHLLVLGTPLLTILHDMRLYEELLPYIPRVAPIEWKDQIRVENAEYSKEDIIKREKESNKTFKPQHKQAQGYLIQYDNDGAFGYMVFDGDTIDGIVDRFGINQYDLELANFWYEVHENGEYENGMGTFELQEGDILYLPDYYIPRNGTLFYSYNRNTNTGVKVKKEQGKFEKNFLGENLTYKALKDILSKFSDDFDDNTRTYNFEVSGSIAITAQLSAFFYLGFDGKFGASAVSGDTRGLNIDSYWSIGEEMGVGNKSIAHAGYSVGLQRSLSLLEAINGRYTSIKHFMAFLELNMYKYMHKNGWDDTLDEMGINKEYWKHVMSEKGEVYDEISKGYVRKVNTNFVAQVGLGVDDLAGIDFGYQLNTSENYLVDKLETWDNIEDYLKIDSNEQLEKYKQLDLSDKKFAKLTTANGFEGNLYFEDIMSSTNNNDLGEYLHLQITMPNYSVSNDGDNFKTLNDFAKGLKDAFNKNKSLFKWIGQNPKSASALEAKNAALGEQIDEVTTSELNRQKNSDATRKTNQEKLDNLQIKKEKRQSQFDNANSTGKQKKYKNQVEKADNQIKAQQKAIKEIDAQYVAAGKKADQKIDDLNKQRTKGEAKLNRTKEVTKRFNSELKDFSSNTEFKPTKTEMRAYTKLYLCFQATPAGYRQHYFRVAEGIVMEASKGVGKGLFSAEGEILMSSEVEVFESLGENTIAYTSLVYNSINKEGIERLNGEKAKEYDDLAKEIMEDVKAGNENRILSMVHIDNIELIGMRSYPMPDYYFDQAMGRIMHSFRMGSIYNNSFDMKRWSPNKQKNFSKAVEYIKANISAEKYPSLVLAYAQQMKSYGKSEAMDR